MLLSCDQPMDGPDRKSTRLNSSHLGISYAVFCLKKKQYEAILMIIGSAADFGVSQASADAVRNKPFGGEERGQVVPHFFFKNPAYNQVQNFPLPSLFPL